MSREEYIGYTPYLMEDGRVIIGSKNTTVYLVDARTGTVVQTYGSENFRSSVGEEIVLGGNDSEALVSRKSKKVRQLLYIMRTDYELLCHSPGTKEILWSVKFANIEAEFRCQGKKNAFSMHPFEVGNEPAEYFDFAELPWPCQTKVSVFQSRDNSLIEALSLLGSVGRLRLLPASEQNDPLLASDGRSPLALPDNQRGKILALPQSEAEDLRMVEGGVVSRGNDLYTVEGGLVSNVNNPNAYLEISKGSFVQSIVALIISLLSIIGFFFQRAKQSKLSKQIEEVKAQAVTSKKKKSRRVEKGKNSANSEKSQKSISSETQSGKHGGSPLFEGNDNKFLLTFNNVVDAPLDGRRIGKLVVYNREIAKGSNGTVVLEGIYEGRAVAVKRLVQTHHDVALKEIQNLIASDQHPNIVRWYGVEFDQDFVYLSLERCTCSLSDLIYVLSRSFQNQETTRNRDPSKSDEFIIRLQEIMDNNKDVELWKENGYPSSLLLKLMRLAEAVCCHFLSVGKTK